MTKNVNEMSDEEFAEQMVPNHGDMAMAGAFVAAQERLDPHEMLHLYITTTESGRLIQMLIALSETVIQSLNLRNDPKALKAFQADITNHALKQAMIDNEKGDNAS